jgi:hypothetical protein
MIKDKSASTDADQTIAAVPFARAANAPRDTVKLHINPETQAKRDRVIAAIAEAAAAGDVATPKRSIFDESYAPLGIEHRKQWSRSDRKR